MTGKDSFKSPAGQDPLWRSLEEAAGIPSSDPAVAGEADGPAGLDRRTLLQFMAMSLGGGGLAACSETDGARPLLSSPRGEPGRLPGDPLVFATCLDHDGSGIGVLVTTRNGRAGKIHGNPLHPASLGASDPWIETELYALHDPTRLKAPWEGGDERNPAALGRFLGIARETLATRRGRGLHVLSRPIASPTVDRMMAGLAEGMPEAAWHAYDPLMSDNARAGAEMAFGVATDTVYDFAQADVILCLGGDPFLEGPGHIRYAADYAARRRAARGPGDLPRLHVAESQPGITGARADQRVVLPPHAFEAFARAILTALDGTLLTSDATPFWQEATLIAADLARARERGLVTAGREQPAIIHALAHAIHAKLGAIGHTVRHIAPIAPTPVGSIAAIRTLAEEIRAGRVTHLLILGGNPAYDAPADLGFADLIRQVPVSAHLTLSENETSLACNWCIPQRHALESWGDRRTFDGTVSFRQPAVANAAPAYSVEEFIALFLGAPPDGQDLVRTTWRGKLPGDFEAAWLAALENGVVPDSASPTLDVALRPDWDSGSTAGPQPEEFTILFASDASVRDGMHADNAWLQELPRPLTKICWGNAALVAPATAQRLGLANRDVVAIRSGEAVLEAPVWLAPGHAPDTLTLPLGYGRTTAGPVGRGIGFNAYHLRFSARPWSLPGVTVTPTGAKGDIVSTQEHHRIDSDTIVRVVSSPNGVAEPSAGPQASFHTRQPQGEHAWGMAIDLDACIGCNACVVACQSENSVPAVGPEEVARGREMHWLRVDRYHAGDADTPDTRFQPVPCMHCEKAPCEVVCPVNATVHSSEGLNDMVYARCIGTRTCSNNCPYKVRRFNWFDYGNRDFAAAAATDPEVPPRSRGVMEKCTYCVQRIRSARIAAQLEDRPVRDGDVVTACQQACPTRAIVFGDLDDPDSAVSRLKTSPRHYALLGDLDVRPRTTYLARIEADRIPSDDDEPR